MAKSAPRLTIYQRWKNEFEQDCSAVQGIEISQQVELIEKCEEQVLKGNMNWGTHAELLNILSRSLDKVTWN